MEEHLWRNLVGEMESSKIIYEINLFCNRPCEKIMSVSYEILLLDHDFVKANKHKLTPSVYATCEIKSPSWSVDPEITFSCPTYITIRTGKHDSSTAYTHDRDFDHLSELKEFDEIVNMKKQLSS